jgi:hypothetical protein
MLPEHDITIHDSESKSSIVVIRKRIEGDDTDYDAEDFDEEEEEKTTSKSTRSSKKIH